MWHLKFGIEDLTKRKIFRNRIFPLKIAICEHLFCLVMNLKSSNSFLKSTWYRYILPYTLSFENFFGNVLVNRALGPKFWFIWLKNEYHNVFTNMTSTKLQVKPYTYLSLIPNWAAINSFMEV